MTVILNGTEGHITDPRYSSPMRLDGATATLQTIEYEHHEVHSGSSFMTHFHNTTANSDDDRSVIAFKTPNTTKWFHIVETITASSPAEFFILEDPATLDLDEGTEAIAYNRDRNNLTASTCIPITTAATAGSITTYTEAQINGATLAGGTNIYHTVLAGGEGPRAVGGTGRGVTRDNIKAKQGVSFIMQNIGANANKHAIALNWYEHTNRS